MNFFKILGIGVLIIISLTLLGPIIGFGIGAFLLYYSYTSFKQSHSILQKTFLFIVGFIGLSITLQTAPAIIGVVAIGFLIHFYAQYKRNKREVRSSL